MHMHAILRTMEAHDVHWTYQLSGLISERAKVNMSIHMNYITLQSVHGFPMKWMFVWAIWDAGAY